MVDSSTSAPVIELLATSAPVSEPLATSTPCTVPSRTSTLRIVLSLMSALVISVAAATPPPVPRTSAPNATAIAGDGTRSHFILFPLPHCPHPPPGQTGQ